MKGSVLCIVLSHLTALKLKTQEPWQGACVASLSPHLVTWQLSLLWSPISVLHSPLRTGGSVAGVALCQTSGEMFRMLPISVTRSLSAGDTSCPP